MFGREKIATLVAEFLGAGALTLLVLTVQRSTIGVPFFVAAAAGLSIVLMTFVLVGASKAYFNPAITLGMWTARKIDTISAIMYIAVQLLGGWLAYYLYVYFTGGNSLQPIGGDFKGTILAAEAVGAGVFAFGLAAAIYQGATRAATAAFVGLSLMLGILIASSASIGLLNPAVALGVRAWEWGTYVAGPVLGAVIGINLYYYLFAPSEVGFARAAVSRPASTKKTTAKKKTRAKK